MEKLIDESIDLYRKGHSLKDKVGGCFTSPGTLKNGKDRIRIASYGEKPQGALEKDSS